MGGASVNCFIQPINNKQINLVCPKGTNIQYKNHKVLSKFGNNFTQSIPNLLKFGVIPYKDVQQNICKNSKITNNKCHDHINQKYIDDQLKECSKDPKSKSKCLINFFDENKKMQVFKDTLTDDLKKECYKDSNFFIQVACEVPFERM